MARIYPFRALRYNPSLVRVEDCVTQPYDKITPSMQQSYYARSPYNLVRIILGLPELFDEPGVNDVYTRAARDLRDWRKKGVLAQEGEPCVFAYAQRFTVPGTGETAERRGLIALGGVVPYADGVVFRHEQTHTKARTDRMNLLKATRAHFGQIFMLYSDPAHTVESLVFRGAAVPDIEVTDEYSVQHRVWKVNDPATVNMVQGALADKKLIIADGHHRYETALAYAEAHTPEHAKRTGPGQPPFPEAAVMMTLVNMDSPGLHILPTHRVVSGLEGFQSVDFAYKIGQVFSKISGSEAPPRNTDVLLSELAHATKMAGPGATTMLAVMRDRILTLTLDVENRHERFPGISERQSQLDMVVLHRGVIDRVLGISAEQVRAGEHVSYQRDAGEAVGAVLRGEAQVAFLVNPVTLDQLRENTFAGEVMPQKSTDFYPKLLSGLAVYALDEAERA